MFKSKAKSEDIDYTVMQCVLRVSSAQEQRFSEWLEQLRWLYNHALHERKNAYKLKRQNISYTKQQNALPGLKKKFPTLKDVPSQALQDCLARVQMAYNHMFRRIAERQAGRKVKTGAPRYKKFGQVCSFTYTQVWKNQTIEVKKNGETVEEIEVRQVIHLLDQDFNEVKKKSNTKDFQPFWGWLKLPKIGHVKVKVHRNFDLDDAKKITIKKMPDGRWFASICLEEYVAKKEPQSYVLLTEDSNTDERCYTTGVDLGLSKFATLSDGQSFEHPRALYKSEHKLKRAQKKLSRKKKGSNNYEKQRKKVAKIHQKIKYQRQDFLHKLSFWLVMNFEFISFEDLNIPAMVKNRRFSKSILDAGWSTLVDFVTYKSLKLGGKVTKVDPKYTTQDCSGCGTRVPKTIAERIHECPKCGLVMCRDQNAAINIEKRGRAGTAQT